MSEWRAKTNTGRVVYDRKLNRFTYKSLARILRNLMEFYGGSDPWNVYFVLFYAAQNARRRVLDVIEDAVEWATELVDLPSWLDISYEVLKIIRDLAREWWARHGPISFKQALSKLIVAQGSRATAVDPQAAPPPYDLSNPFVRDLVFIRDRVIEILEEVGYG